MCLSRSTCCFSALTLCSWTWASDFGEAVTQWREVALWALLSLCKRWSWVKKSLLALLKAWDKGSQPLMNCCNCRVSRGALQLLYTRWRRGCQRGVSSEVKGGSGKVFSPWSILSGGGEAQQHLVWRGCFFLSVSCMLLHSNTVVKANFRALGLRTQVKTGCKDEYAPLLGLSLTYCEINMIKLTIVCPLGTWNRKTIIVLLYLWYYIINNMNNLFVCNFL